MKVIDAGVSGTNDFSSGVQWQDLFISSKWLEVINILAPGTQPRKAQTEALQDKRILTNRRNLVVSSPTNSGKSLIGLLILLEAIARGKRALLIEPLRALAQEKMDELSQMAGELSIALGEPMRVTISTGDYRLEHEDFASPPPNTGELIIMTPERLDAILRNPDYDNWVHSIGAVCVDEAHLIRSSRRGPTLEYVITFMLSLQSPPRIVLLSATLGNLDMVETWLHPCDIVQVTQRYPTLEKSVIALEEADNVDEVLLDISSSILADKQTNLLIFVYQTQSATRLAKVLNEALPDINAQAYHAQLSSERRQSVKQYFEQGNCRCLVTTTALGLGVNLPASHVIVRDTTFYGQGYLDIDELLQMMGRAGRRDTKGTAIVFLRKTDKWQAEVLAESLQNPQLPALTSRFDTTVSSDTVPIIAERVAAYLARNHTNGRTAPEIESFFNNSLGGTAQAAQVKAALAWLMSPRHTIAYKDETGKYRLTTLGMKAVLAAMPLELVCGFAQLMRDILTVNPEDTIIEQWTSLDVLVLLHLLYSRTPNLRLYSKTLVQQVDS
jgi:helicase